MGIIYLRFFFHTEDVKYLEPAEKHFRNALAAGCRELAYIVSASNNLAISLKHRFDVTKNDVDINTAVAQFSSLLQKMRETIPNWAA